MPLFGSAMSGFYLCRPRLVNQGSSITPVRAPLFRHSDNRPVRRVSAASARTSARGEGAETDLVEILGKCLISRERSLAC